MLIADLFKIPIAVSLGVIALILGASVVASILRPASPVPPAIHPPRDAPAADEHPGH
jgi:tellurite resistance protein TerC